MNLVFLVASPALTLTLETRLARTWRERLFTRPWHPWQAERTVTHTIPDPRLYRLGAVCVVGHPATLQKFRSRHYSAQLRAEGRLN